MSVPIFFDPCPVPAKVYAERMGVTLETLVLMHVKGDFRALEKIGRNWFVMPARVIQLSLDGDSQEGRAVDGDVEGEGAGLLRSHGGGSRAEEVRGGKAGLSGADGYSNPLD
jgi:hypothetical protein